VKVVDGEDGSVGRATRGAGQRVELDAVDEPATAVADGLHLDCGLRRKYTLAYEHTRGVECKERLGR